MFKRITILLYLLFTVTGCGGWNPLPGYVEKNKYNGRYWYLSDVFADTDARELALAAARGDVEKIHKLHEKGVDINYRGKEGITPLLWAIYAENKMGFEELLKLGANPNLTTDPESGAMNIIRYAAEDPEETFFLAKILEHGGNPNYVIPIVDQPLIHNVCDHGSIKRLEMVGAAGADINKREQTGRTPVMSCAFFRQYDKALYLLERGVKYNNSIVDQYNDSLSVFVAEYPPSPTIREQYEAYKKVIEFLAKHGIKVEEKKKPKRTRLHYPKTNPVLPEN